MQILEAEVIDANHLRLVNPIQSVPGSKIRIAAAPAEDISADHELWLLLSLQNFAAAYSDNEPEYSTELIKEANPEFNL